jgi:hypothetical protein
MLRFGDEAGIVCEKKAVFELGCRAHGHVKEADQLPITTPTVATPASFRDVGGNGSRGAAQLSSESKSLKVRKRCGQPVRRECELVGALPDLELAKAFHSGLETLRFPRRMR